MKTASGIVYQLQKEFEAGYAHLQSYHVKSRMFIFILLKLIRRASVVLITFTHHLTYEFEM